MGRPNEQVKTRRLLTLYGFLRQQGLFSGRDDGDGFAHIAAADVATQLGWPVDEVVRLAEALATCGSDGFLLVPLWLDEDMPGRTLLCATRYDALANPLRLCEEERLALLQVLALTGVGESSHLAQELSKSLPEATPSGNDPLEMPVTIGNSFTADLFPVIASAIAGRHLLEFDYLKAGARSPEHRRVEPLSLSYEGGKLYLVSYCTVNGGTRMFALERMALPVETEEPFIPRTVDVRRFIDRLDDGFPSAQLRFLPGFKVERRDWPGLKLAAPAPDGSVTGSIPFTGGVWLPVQVVRHQGMVEALAPEALRTAVAATLEERRLAARASLEAWQVL